MPEPKVFSLKLARWQKRMIKDFLDIELADVSSMLITKGIPIQWVTYRVPNYKKAEWNLYLTDQQIAQVKKELGLKVAVSALAISPEMVKEGTLVFK